MSISLVLAPGLFRGGEESERGGEGVAREAIAIGFLAMAERSILTLKY